MTVSINPPPGPLSWLFPELERYEPEVGVDIDLAKSPMLARELHSRIAGAGEIRVADGPRGRTLARALQEVWRDKRIFVDDAIPQLESVLVSARSDTGLLLVHADRVLEDLAHGFGAELGSRVPVFVTRPEPAADATTRLPESWWGLVPGDHYPDDARRAYHAVMRRLWPERYLELRALEAAALAGIDVYDEVVRGRYDRGFPVASPAVAGPLILGIDGIDGAGKSSQIAALRAHLEARGLRVAVHKIYRHGVFHDTVTDLTRQCAGDRNLHLWPLQRRIKLFDSVKYLCSHVAKDLERCDVLIFDRYVQTHYAAGLGRYGHDPYAREMLSVYPTAYRVFLLDLPESVALERLAEREHRTVDENPYMLSRFRAALLELVDREDLVVLDARASFETNRDAILSEVERVLEARP